MQKAEKENHPDANGTKRGTAWRKRKRNERVGEGGRKKEEVQAWKDTDTPPKGEQDTILSQE